jgi:hypothetical protein|nr:MAG TPA: minor capsid protein [Caudoviricetes sp.]
MNRYYLELVEEARRKKLILVDDCKQELSKLYLRAYKDINNKVFTKDSNIWAMQYRDELKKRTKELNPILYETVKNYAEKSADIGVYPEWALFSKILGDKDHEILNTLTRIPEEVVRELLNGDMYKDNQGLNKRIWRFQKENEQKIDYIIQRGLIEKKSTFEIAKDLEMYVNPKAKKTFEWKKVYPNAGNKTIDFNAYRLASTSITHAYQMATIRAAQANPFSEGVKWHSVLSQRTCQLCKERHGKIFKAEDVPLDHPLGLCTTYSVITKSLKEISEELKKGVISNNSINNNPLNDNKVVENSQNIVYNIPKNRQEAKKMLVRQIGFNSIQNSFDLIDEELAIANTLQLAKLEDKFGAIHKSIGGIGAEDSQGTVAYVSHQLVNLTNQSLSLCKTHFKDKSTFIKNEMNSITIGFAMPAKLIDEELMIYTVTHEYGHMLQNVLVRQAYEDNGWTEKDRMQFVDFTKSTKKGQFKWYNNIKTRVQKECADEIIDIAKKNNSDFKLSDNLSSYGKTNHAEFFAEVFANSQLGEPNELGNAMNIWLKKKGLILNEK